MTISRSSEPLIQIIERFNRKERYIVFQQVATAGEVHLDPCFRAKLVAKGWPVRDQDVLVLTDYHLDWLYAALELHAGRWASDTSGHKHRRDVASVTTDDADGPRRALESKQEDIDLLLVWKDGDVTHLGLIEAKAHSGWTNKQMRSKAARLAAVIGDGNRGRYDAVVPHFALLSYKAPTLETSSWPFWMCAGEPQPCHIDLATPTKSRYSVGRVDESGKSSKAGDYFGVRVSAHGVDE